MNESSSFLGDPQVAIVGGGIMGCASAYYLARSGVPVALFEKSAKVGQEASGVNAGGVRQHGRASQEMPLGIAAIQMWKTLGEELEFDLEYRQGGHLRLATTGEEFGLLAESVHAQQALGLTDLYLLDEKQVREMVPNLAPRFVGASYCPSDGQASPLRACRAFARAATKHGAAVHLNAEVIGIEVLGNQNFVVRTSLGIVRPRWVVNAAGAWAGRVARMVGINLPVTPKYWQTMATEILPPFLKQVLTWPKGEGDEGPWRNLNLKQMSHGQLVISGAWTGTGDVNSMRREVTYEGVTGSARDLTHLFPHLAGISLRRAWVGVDGHSPDDVLCMGPVSAVPGFLMAGPGSGHSFALGPIVGKLLAELITTGHTSLPIDVFRLERFGALPENSRQGAAA